MIRAHKSEDCSVDKTLSRRPVLNPKFAPLVVKGKGEYASLHSYSGNIVVRIAQTRLDELEKASQNNWICSHSIYLYICIYIYSSYTLIYSWTISVII